MSLARSADMGSGGDSRSAVNWYPYQGYNQNSQRNDRNQNTGISWDAGWDFKVH